MPKRILTSRTGMCAQCGLAVVEYAVAGGLIGAAIVAAFLLLGPAIAQALMRMASVFV